MKKVAVVYHNWPHYRTAVGVALDRSRKYSYTFYGDLKGIEGIKVADPTKFRHFVDAPYRFYGKVMWQPNALRPAVDRETDIVIYHCDPKFFFSWIGTIVARAKGKKVLFWGHGWLRRERGLKRLIRNFYYNLAQHVLVYSERGKQLGVGAGFPADKITTIYNSLDTDAGRTVLDRIETGKLADHDPHAFFAHPDRPLIICTARLIKVCQFDILFDAAHRLKEAGRPVNILLVGDGTEREHLERLAANLGIEVHFFGACYDEAVIGQLIHRADVTVSPGKIGLTAMHSLMYGTPAITHGEFEAQMPEFEAIMPGRTGAFFRRGDAEDLAAVLTDWFERARDRRATIQADCLRCIDEKWNPEAQVMLIEQAIDGIVDRRAQGA